MMKKFLVFILCLTVGFNGFSKKKPEVKLGQITMFNGTVKIKIPADFKQIPETKLSSFYPKEAKPKLAYANAARDIRIAFDAESLNADERAMPVITSIIEKGLKGLHPKAKWKDEGVKDISKHRVGYIEYINKKPEKFYELVFFASFRGQLISCTFHAPKKGHKPWKAVAREMMESLILEKEKK